MPMLIEFDGLLVDSRRASTRGDAMERSRSDDSGRGKRLIDQIRDLIKVLCAETVLIEKVLKLVSEYVLD